MQCREFMPEGVSATRLPNGYTLHQLDIVASTNDEAKRLARLGAVERTVIRAEEQAAGRGRYGREWLSPRGNLYTSFIFRPPVPPREAAKIGYVAALAIADVVAGLVGDSSSVNCKWPNDVLVRDHKIAGILPESAMDAGGDLEWIVLGVGVNIQSHPKASRWPSINLSALGAAALDPLTVLSALCRALDKWLDRWLTGGFGPIRDTWIDRAWSIGQDIRVELPERSIVGRFVGIDPGGALLLAGVDGRREKIHYGEVFPAEVH